MQYITILYCYIYYFFYVVTFTTFDITFYLNISLLVIYETSTFMLSHFNWTYLLLVIYELFFSNFRNILVFKFEIQSNFHMIIIRCCHISYFYYHNLNISSYGLITCTIFPTSFELAFVLDLKFLCLALKISILKTL